MASKQYETEAENPSQTIPMITEELASASTTTHHVTTPVMPPNPIRRDTVPMPVPEPEVLAEPGPIAESEAPPETALQDVGTKGNAEKKEKSEGRVSATQLLAGAAAAATSSVIGGQLGVAGTVVGAGVASIITGLAVTLYTSSLDKGKEKIKEVGSKLAPAVKAKSLGVRTQRSAAVAADQTESTFGSLSDKSADADADAQATTVGGETKSRWQKLRRRRVLYPVAIAVATFGIGLGAVVMAESLTDADISPGTSQLSRSVSGGSGAGHDSGASQDGGSTADSGSSGADPHPVQNPNQGSGNEGSTAREAQSTSANEGSSTTSSSADQTGADQGADSSSSAAISDDTAGAGSDSSGFSSAAADASGGGAASSGGSSSSGSQDGTGSSGSGSSSADSGAGGDSGSSSAGSGSDATAEG